jgi:hypothetical protein
MAPTGGTKRKRSSFTEAVEFHGDTTEDPDTLHGDTTEEDPDMQDDATDQNIMPLHWDIWYRMCYLVCRLSFPSSTPSTNSLLAA